MDFIIHVSPAPVPQYHLLLIHLLLNPESVCDAPIKVFFCCCCCRMNSNTPTSEFLTKLALSAIPFPLSIIVLKAVCLVRVSKSFCKIASNYLVNEGSKDLRCQSRCLLHHITPHAILLPSQLVHRCIGWPSDSATLKASLQRTYC